MALIIYPTTDWDSFCDVTDADTILSNNVPSSQLTSWNALTLTDKEIYLRQATLLISNKITVPSTLESNLKKACAYLAWYSVGKDMTASDGSNNLKRKSIDGVIEKEWFAPSNKSNDLPDIVDMLLKDYGAVSDGSFVFARG